MQLYNACLKIYLWKKAIVEPFKEARLTAYSLTDQKFLQLDGKLHFPMSSSSVQLELELPGDEFSQNSLDVIGHRVPALQEHPITLHRRHIIKGPVNAFLLPGKTSSYDKNEAKKIIFTDTKNIN